MNLQGRIGQVLGPFDPNIDIMNSGQVIPKVATKDGDGIIIISKLGVQTEPGTEMIINGASIKVGSTGIYELDNVVNVTSLIFPNGASENTIIDFVY